MDGSTRNSTASIKVEISHLVLGIDLSNGRATGVDESCKVSPSLNNGVELSRTSTT